MWKITPSSELVEISADEHKDKEAVWLPIDDMTFFQPEMPTKSKKSWRQTIPFALEDSLIAPIEKTHFAYDKNAAEQVPVVAISKHQLDDYLALAQEQQITPRKLIAELYALPYADEQITVWHEGERCLMRDGYHSGNVGSTDWIASLVSVSAHSSHLDIYSDDIKALPEAWQKNAQPLPASLDEMMARGAPSDAINLLQGDYGSEDVAAAYIKPWRIAISLALVAFTAHLAVMFFDTQRYNLYADNAHRQSEQLVKQLLIPGGDIVDVRTQVTRYIQRLKSYSEQRQENAWTMLAQVDNLLSNCMHCRVEKLELDSRSLTLDISFGEESSDFKQKIENLAGFKVMSKRLRAREEITEGEDTKVQRGLVQFKLFKTRAKPS